MKLQIYENIKAFGDDTLDILLENEVQNNLPISFITSTADIDRSNWFLATVKNDSGSVLLTAACTPPFNLVGYLTRNQPNDAVVKLLSDEIKAMGITLPGVLAEQSFARAFAEAHVGKNGFESHMTANIMQLDEVSDLEKMPGQMREIDGSDLYYIPYWMRAFREDCRIETYSIEEEEKRIKLHTGTLFVWQDFIPMSQAGTERKTINGAGVGYVYTPPHFRGKGYASSVVSELSQLLLERGNKFCFLFADAANPISCGIYRKIGYVDKCVFAQLDFI